ncbi:MAG: glycosyltransferase family 39 protein [Planctomycetia bacterium]|nr:glycosyltransferase family 39 protein [Planctomycetia bacterium]
MSEGRDWSIPAVRWIFGSAVLLHVLLWTFGPFFFLPNYRLDTVEMLVIGQNWVLSTNKHPAMQSWIVESLGWLTHHAEWTPYLAAQLSVVFSVLGIWCMASRCFSRKVAVLVAIAMLGFYYFNYESIQYNNKSFYRAFWIWAAYFLSCAVEENRLRYWILTGICLAAGLYCNLMMFLLVLTILVYMALDPDARKYWKTSGPYVSTGVCFLLFLPLFVWIVQNDFPQLEHARRSISEDAGGIGGRLVHPLAFLGAQVLSWITIVLPLLPLTGFHWRWKRGIWGNSRQRLVFLLLWVPLLVELGTGMVTGGSISSGKGCQNWLFFLIFLFSVVRIRTEESAYRRAVVLCFANILFLFTLSVAVVVLGALRGTGTSRILYPGKALAGVVEQAWQEQTDAPLAWVRGDHWTAGCVSVYASSRPRVWSSLWSDEETFGRTGGMLVWIEPTPEAPTRRYSLLDWYGTDLYYGEADEPTEWLKKFPQAVVLPDVVLEHHYGRQRPSIKVGMAYVPPEVWEPGHALQP